MAGFKDADIKKKSTEENATTTKWKKPFSKIQKKNWKKTE